MIIFTLHQKYLLRFFTGSVICLLFASLFFLKQPKQVIQNHHLSTQQGWSNDLQTIVWNDADKRYDIYFLHSIDGATNPFGSQGQNWVHTSTKDFVNYSKQKSAIPAKGGHHSSGWQSAWTGSIIQNHTNLSGLPSNSKVAYFSGIRKSDQKQAIYAAYSSDNGETFNHPINDGKPLLDASRATNQSDFRDPYVFYFKDRLFMYVAEKDSIGVYQSHDGVVWEKADSGASKIENQTFFYDRSWEGNAPVECPVIKTMISPNGHIKQVLFFGAKDSNRGETTGTYYTIGHLDDNGLFVAEKSTQRLDHGTDYYGANFSGYEGIDQINTDLISLGWVGNWNYFTSGIHSDTKAESPFLERIGFYSSPRRLVLTDHLTIVQTPFYQKSQLKTKTIYKNITPKKPVSLKKEPWIYHQENRKKIHGLYDMPNQIASAHYQLIFSTKLEHYSDDIFIDIWQEEDYVRLHYSPTSGLYTVKTYASELNKGIDGQQNASSYYFDGHLGHGLGYKVQNKPIKKQKLNITVVTDNRSVEFFFPDGSTYTLARFNTSGRQDFKIFTTVTNDTNQLDMTIASLN